MAGILGKLTKTDKYYKYDNEKLGTLLQKDQEQTTNHHFYRFDLSV